MKLKVLNVVGTRPNFMKIAPIYEEMKKHPAAFEPILVHTGQHYDANMSKVFFEDLELPQPDIYLGVGSGSHARQTAEMMKRFEPQLLEHKPDMILVVGDVNSTLACALTAKKLLMPSKRLAQLWQRFEVALQRRQPPPTHRPSRVRSRATPMLAHVEAGERSFDFSMPEEINRVETDVLSDLLFTTSHDSDHHLLAEGIDARTIFRVGNVMIDALQRFIKKAADSQILQELNRARLGHLSPIQAGEFALVTLHRPGNVDDPQTLSTILAALTRVSHDLSIVFPMHPRTRKLMKNLDEQLIDRVFGDHLFITEPLGYLDFLHLQSQARVVLTDSGGVQVETSYLGVPCLTLRPNTEWRITLREGTNRLVAPNEAEIVSAFKTALSQDKNQPANIEFWDGRTAERIVNHLIQMFELK